MSEKLLQKNEAQTESVTDGPATGATELNQAAEETQTAETMADYEEHFDDANPWNVVKRYMEEKTRLPIKIEGIVNGGAIAMVEGLRGFIPASRLSLSYIENLEDYLLKELTVMVIDVNETENRLVLSAREILKEEEKAAKEAKIAAVKVGSIMKGVVDSLQNYGAFINLEDGLSGLVHVSQISSKRVKYPSDVLNKGDEVEVKIIGIKDGKISLSMKALEEKTEEVPEKVHIPKTESIGTNLGDLFKNIKL
ncbi:MAG: S1 RNA-binding domain-containing protein [Dorea sp.]|jgi:small subunit ribosomal protein S1|nr:S1 RNA-binding domain-containing protein [Dorea sp.]